MLKQLLKRLEVEYEERNTEDISFMEEAFNHAGMSIVPVLVVGGEVITGYNPKRVLETLSTRS